MSSILDFFLSLYGEEPPGSIVLWTSDDKRSHWFTDLKKAAAEAARLSSKGNCYMGMGLQDPHRALELKRRDKPEAELAHTRGTENSVTAIPGLWMDIDVAGANHAQADLPGSVEEALELINGFALPPTMVVATGGGVHAHWLFNEPLEFEEPDERIAAKEMLTRLQFTLQQSASLQGWKLDSTNDLARVLRPPGTLNHKSSPPKPVTVLINNPANRYELEDFDGACRQEAVVYEEKKGGRVNPAEILRGVPSGSRDVEIFKYASHLRARGVQRVEAEALILVAARACDPPFPDNEALAKLDSAWKYAEGTDRTKMAQEARSKLADISALPREEILTTETIGALALIHDTDPIEYANIKAQLKGKVNLNDLNRLVNQARRQLHNLEVVSGDTTTPPMGDYMKDIPLPELRKPHQWTVNENGIWQDTDQGPIRAFPTRAFLTKRIKRLDGGPEKWELSWYDYGLEKWEDIMAPGSVVFSNSAIISLRDIKNLPVSTDNAKAFIRYLTDLEAENQRVIPIVRATGTLGWVSKDIFIPGLQKDVIIDVPDKDMKSLTDAYSPQGTIEEWMNVVRPLRERAVSRFLLAAGFASPLLHILKERVFLIHVYGTSSGGKTVAIQAGLSVWGNPHKTLMSFNSTKVYIERMAALFSDLPLGIDEKQMQKDNQAMVDALIYILGSGKSKGRGSKGGGVQSSDEWHSIVMTSGEEPLTSTTAASGLKNRAMELYEPNTIPDENYSEKLREQLDLAHGTAGPIFIKNLYATTKEDATWVKEGRDEIREVMAATPDAVRGYARYVSAVCVGDWLSSMWVWGLEPEEAKKQAIKLGQDIMNQLETKAEIDQSTIAHNYLMSWYEEHYINFRSDAGDRPSYGFREGDILYILPNAFEAAMKRGGLSAGRALRDWANDKTLITSQDGDKVRFKVKKTSPITHIRGYYIAVKIRRELPIPENDELF